MEPINYALLKGLDEQFGTPFYLMDVEKYRSNINNFLTAFRKRYEKVVAGYSFKTNYVPALCKIALDEGVMAEVVSEMEYELARRIGFEKVIFNGPIKRPAIFEKALEHGAIINLDSEYEVEMICEYAKNHPDADLQVGMRININLTDENGYSTIQCGLRFGRFGFPSDIIGHNIERLREAGVKIVSLHGHTSTSDRAVLNYKIITQHMLQVCEQYGLNELEWFDIGGGYFGAAPEGMDLTGRPTYEDYANCVLDEALASEWFVRVQPTIVIEPGSSVVSNVFSYYTKVYQNKKVGKVNFVMVDGTVFDVKPTLHSNNLPHDVYRAVETGDYYTCDVVGSTCMEKDVLLKEGVLPKLNAGDFLRFKGVGAYTICLTPTFINFLAPILSLEDGEYKEKRRRQTVDDILTNYKA
jgi:diaminopimelate decarboxylase